VVSEATASVPAMQLVDVGRNEPCSCGSGRKYKKCCLALRDAAVAVDPELVAAVDQATASGDREALHARIAAAMPVFARGAPLEHVRFPHDAIRSRSPDRAELAQMCTSGWQGRCELEIAHVLDRFELEAAQRDGLRLAVYLLRRFGALSPTVEHIARLQVDEHVRRVRRFAGAVSARGLTTEQVLAGIDGLLDWLELARPTVLSFAGWFALRTASDAQLPGRWRSGIAMRVCETSLDQLEDASVEHPQLWLLLAASTLFIDGSPLGSVLPDLTTPRLVTEIERSVHAGIEGARRSEKLRGAVHRILRETEARGEFGDAALLRAVMWDVQSAHRPQGASTAPAR
jgi:hypothetical protein